MSELTVKYKEFFESVPGQQAIEKLENLITANYRKAENDPDHSRDYFQQAKGNREAINLIKGLTMEASKPG
jgi:hypothetical protein